MAAEHGDWRRAAVLFGHAARLPGGSNDPRLIASLAEAQLRLGDRARALAKARLAYALQRTSPRATGVLAAALAASGERAGEADVLLAKRAGLGEQALALR